MTSIIKGVIGQARKLGDPLANIIKEYNIVGLFNVARAKSEHLSG